MLGIVGRTVARCVKSFPRTHLKRVHTDSRVYSANTELSSPPLLCAWMNKFRQNYIEMHVLANILVNSRLRKACLNVKSGERKGMCISILNLCFHS